MTYIHRHAPNARWPHVISVRDEAGAIVFIARGQTKREAQWRAKTWVAERKAKAKQPA
jgi:hypothetical protein